MNKRTRVFKLSQDATNEIWSVTMQRNYRTPGDKKRAIELVIRSALEELAGLKSTCDGYEDGVDPVFGKTTTRPQRNPFAGGTVP